MKTLMIILSYLLIGQSVLAVDITCEADPKSGVAFPEKPIVIKLGEEKDTFSIEGDKEKITMKASEEDRLKWNYFLPFIELDIDFDIRNQKVIFYDEDRKAEEEVSIICKNVEEAEQEWIMNALITPGKLEAAGMNADMNVVDSGRGLQTKSFLDSSDVGGAAPAEVLQQ